MILVEGYFKRQYKEFFYYSLEINFSNFQCQTAEHIIAYTLSLIYKNVVQNFVCFSLSLFLISAGFPSAIALYGHLILLPLEKPILLVS